MKHAGKPPVPRYHYKLVTVASSREAGLVEGLLRDRLRSAGLSFFTLCRMGGTCDVMGDSGTSPMANEALATARAVAVKSLEHAGLHASR